MTKPTASVDLLASNVRAGIFDAYEELRRVGPVVWNPRLGCWLVVGYQEAKSILRDHSHFTSTLAHNNSRSLFGGPTMIFQDPPVHTDFRNEVAKHFTSRLGGTLAANLRGLADHFVRYAIERSPVDFVGVVASPLPVRVVMDILGAPIADHRELKRLSDSIVSVGLDGASTARQRRVASAQLHAYFRTQIEGGSELGGLLGEFAVRNREGNGRALAHLAATCSLILIAGHETTTALLGNIALALARHPSEWRMLRADPARSARVVDEVLRYDGPVHALRRVATCDVEVSDALLKAGNHVIVLLAAANRDPSVFADAHRFNVDRPALAAHLAFGTGVHYCLGFALGRAEATAVVRSLAENVGSLSLAEDGPVDYVPSLFVRGLTRLSMNLQARARDHESVGDRKYRDDGGSSGGGELSSRHALPADGESHDSSEVRRAQPALPQRDYHELIFRKLHDWPDSLDRIIDLTGDASTGGLIGLDQMGHFGPHGCEIIADELCAHFKSHGGSEPRVTCELGSGFGGASRQVTLALESETSTAFRAIGIELVLEHAALSRTISSSLDVPFPTPVCADAALQPIRSASLDAVYVAGSMSHFEDAESVFGDAYRVLRPGAILVLTEEVSLVRKGMELSAEFLAIHPPGVFSFDEPGARERQLAKVGFQRVRAADLSEWAIQLLTDRLRALSLFRGTAARIFGESAVSRMEDTLLTTLAEYTRGALVPMLFAAHKPDGIRFPSPKAAINGDEASGDARRSTWSPC